MSGDRSQDAMTAAEELGVIAPDVDVTVTDPDTGEAVTLTLREFRFREGLKAQVAAQPLIAALTALTGDEAVDGESPEPSMIDAVMGEHADAWLQLCGLASDREAGWVARLSDADAREVSGAMWSANGSFFFRRVVEHALTRRPVESVYRSLASLIRSSTPGTGTTSPSQSA